MSVPHKWEKEIKAWADGAEIQVLHTGSQQWQDCSMPKWLDYYFYRVKPKKVDPQYVYVLRYPNPKAVAVYLKNSLDDNFDRSMCVGKIRLST